MSVVTRSGHEIRQTMRLKSKESIRKRLESMDAQFEAISAMANNMEEDFESQKTVSVLSSSSSSLLSLLSSASASTFRRTDTDFYNFVWITQYIQAIDAQYKFKHSGIDWDIKIAPCYIAYQFTVVKDHSTDGNLIGRSILLSLIMCQASGFMHLPFIFTGNAFCSYHDLNFMLILM